MKAFAIFKREYLEAARGRSFALITLLTPLFVCALLALPRLVAGASSVARVVVVDGTGRLGPALDDEIARARRLGSARGAAPGFSPPAPRLEIERAPAAPDFAAALAREVGALAGGARGAGAPAAVLALSPRAGGEDPEARLYVRRAPEAAVTGAIEEVVGRAVARQRVGDRLGAEGDAAAGALLRDAQVETVRVRPAGGGGAERDVDAVLCFAVLLAVLVPMANHGGEVMRSIVREKNERITEVLMSVVSPLDLLVGKIAAFAALGLTQVAAWGVMSWAVTRVLPATEAAPAAGLPAGGLAYAALFFLLGYAMCVCVYAMAGVVARDVREAQQLASPMMVAVMMPLAFVVPIHASPDAGIVVALSMFPPTVPTAMLVRVLVSDPPAWQIAVAIGATLAATAGLYVMAAKLFRVGIWSRGARPSLRTLGAWLRSARV
ncbi:ABC transporter permease [Sorangium sp. So ce131]|uniref:ABC transporter permease n=1 Tax=Sorangium sp. So ce131 TaxID=3133282 RepID=UPI003F63393A